MEASAYFNESIKNKCPIMAPAKTLLPENAERLGIAREYCLANLAKLKQHLEVREKLEQEFKQSYEKDDQVEPEHALYSGSFFSESDKAQMDVLHQLPVEQLANHEFTFTDKRLPSMLFRYRARNYPHLLTDDEKIAGHVDDIIFGDNQTIYLPM